MTESEFNEFIAKIQRSVAAGKRINPECAPGKEEFLAILEGYSASLRMNSELIGIVLMGTRPSMEALELISYLRVHRGALNELLGEV